MGCIERLREEGVTARWPASPEPTEELVPVDDVDGM
jgi:hypothetical protein